MAGEVRFLEEQHPCDAPRSREDVPQRFACRAEPEVLDDPVEEGREGLLGPQPVGLTAVRVDEPFRTERGIRQGGAS